MQRITEKLSANMVGIIASLAFLVTMFNVNTACMYIAHQPKLPKVADKLRKF